MKVRAGFVTNSSSSSYVVARKSTMTRDDMRTYLIPRYEDMRKFVEHELKWFEEDDYRPDEIRDLTPEQIVDGMFNAGVDLLMDTTMDLDAWRINTFRASNEDYWDDLESLFKCFIYANGLTKTDDLKVLEEPC